MGNNLEDFVWNRVIDESQNRARDNELRDEYDRQMSDRNYNNNLINECFEHVMRLIIPNWDSCRSQRDEDDLIAQAVEQGVTQHIGFWVTSDRRLADSIGDDRVYRDLQGAAQEYENAERDYDDWERGGRRDNRDRGRGRDDRGRGGRGRDDRSSGYRQSRPVTSGRERDRRNDRSNIGGSRMNGGFGGVRREEIRDRDERQNDRRDERADRTSSRGPVRQSQTREETRREEPRQESAVVDRTDRVDGPDFSKERPYDDFWTGSEHWQLAHTSSWQWQWSPKQQFCRTYNPELEVRFLVKGADGVIREDFLPMTDDLNFAAHEIRVLTRPNLERRIRDNNGSDQEITLPGEDLDVVDLDNVAVVQEVARKVLLSELNLTSIDRNEKPVVVSTETDAQIEATANRLLSGKDIGVIQSLVVEIAPTSGNGKEELESLGKTITADSDLATLQKRLISLRGKVDESVINTIDQHYTREVNHWLKHYFGFEELKIDTFIGDFGDLMEVITKERSAAFAAQFLTRTRNVVISLVLVTADEAMEELLQTRDVIPEMADAPDDYQSFRRNAIGIMTMSSMISVCLDSEAFGLVDEVVRVPAKDGQAADPELRNTLESLYRTGRQASSTGRVHLVSADNIRFELVGIAGARDVVGIRRA